MPLLVFNLFSQQENKMDEASNSRMCTRMNFEKSLQSIIELPQSSAPLQNGGWWQVRGPQTLPLLESTHKPSLHRFCC